MCGIAGVIYKDKTKKNSAKFNAAANLSKHRGPDHTGLFGNACMDFVHYRLSILDLDERSNQPFSPDGNSVLIYNGEIYNFKELAEKYKLSLQTTSDTEVLYLLLQEKDFQLRELNGILHLAIMIKSNKP